MSGRIEIFVGVVEKVSGPAAQAGATSAVVDQFNSDAKGFALVNQGAQTGAAIAAVLSIAPLTSGAVPFFNIATNTLAGTTTFLKIVAEYKSKHEFNSGDVISLVGNVAGVLGGFVVLGVGSPLLGAGFTVAAIGAIGHSVYNSQLGVNLYNAVVAPVLNSLKEKDANAGKSQDWITPTLKVVGARELLTNFQNQLAVVEWDPSNDTVKLKPYDFFWSEGGGGGGGGGRGTAAAGGGGKTQGPAPALPEVVPRIDIYIESINGEAQDIYICCSAGVQQDRYH